MLSELLGKKKAPSRQHSPAIAEAVIGVRTLREARTELAEEICAVLFTLKRTTRRLEEIPDAIEICEHERFQAMTQHELHPDRQKDREPEFAERRATLLSEQQVLSGKRTVLEGQKGQLEKQMGALKEAIVRAEKVMWEHIVQHLAEDFSRDCRGKFLELWTACWELRDGVAPVQALDRSFDLRLLDAATREKCLAELRLEFDVPA